MVGIDFQPQAPCDGEMLATVRHIAELQADNRTLHERFNALLAFYQAQDGRLHVIEAKWNNRDGAFWALSHVGSLLLGVILSAAAMYEAFRLHVFES